MNSEAYDVMLRAGCSAYVGRRQCAEPPLAVLVMAPEMAVFVAIAMKGHGFAIAAVCEAHRAKREPAPFRERYYHLTADMDPAMKKLLEEKAEVIAAMRKLN